MARQAASYGHKPKFKIPATDLFLRSQRSLKVKFLAFLENDFYHKGTLYHSYFFNPTLPIKSWFSHILLPRDQIVTINRLRSNHYNLNLSLYRKNIINSPLCQCGDPRQDVNFHHVIFRSPLTRNKSQKLLLHLYHLYHLDPNNRCDLFPFIVSLSPKLCRLLSSFFKSSNLSI